MKFLISHPFNQPVANTTLWVHESFVILEYFMWDLWCGWSGNGGGFPLSFFHLPLSITIPPILLLYLDLVVCNNPYQVAYYYILGIQVVGLISNLTHGWLQDSEVFILHTTHKRSWPTQYVNVCNVHWVPRVSNEQNYHKSKLTSRPSASIW
jgi:hypothetical protein